MSLTINLPSIDVSVAKWVVVDKFEDKYKNIRYYIKFHCNTLQNNLNSTTSHDTISFSDCVQILRALIIRYALYSLCWPSSGHVPV